VGANLVLPAGLGRNCDERESPATEVGVKCVTDGRPVWVYRRLGEYLAPEIVSKGLVYGDRRRELARQYGDIGFLDRSPLDRLLEPPGHGSGLGHHDDPLVSRSSRKTRWTVSNSV